MSRLPFLAQRLFNVPIAIHPAKAELVMGALADRFGVSQVFRAGAAGLTPMAFDDDETILRMSRKSEGRPYEVVAGVAVIPIIGTLVQKLGSLQPFSGMTGYDGIRVNLLMASADKDVRAIVLDIDSPGGEVAGCFDLVDLIHGLRGDKPIWAILNEAAYSAAYAIASAADRIVVPRTGGVGSIGVVCLHADMSQALGKAGIAVTVIRFGALKYEGNEYEPLTKDALARIQGPVDAMGELFVETVARNRSIAASVVRATQAGTFDGPAGVRTAVERGFADQVASPDAAFRELFRSL